MQQNGALLGAALVAIALLPYLFTTSCTDSACKDILGGWTNKEGQSIYFLENGKALWLVRFGSTTDTFPMEYRYDCKKHPTELDLTGFQSGPLSGKSLYGIMEWDSDSSFRYDAETGTQAEIRPATFETDQTQKFYREK